jgi:small-conductance mechanosensitive channel
MVTFDSNWQKAKSLLQEIANRHSLSPDIAHQEIESQQQPQKYYYFFKHLTPTVYTNIQENGTRLTIRYLCRPRARRSSEQAIYEDVLKAFSLHTDIQFAYPTMRNVIDQREKPTSSSESLSSNK